MSKTDLRSWTARLQAMHVHPMIDSTIMLPPPCIVRTIAPVAKGNGFLPLGRA